MEKFSFNSIDTSSITEQNLEDIYEAETDGIGTLYWNCGKCSHPWCNHIEDKHTIFSSIDENYKDYSVANLFERYGDKLKSSCHNESVIPYRWRDKIKIIKSRLSANIDNIYENPNSPVESFCILIKNEIWKTIWMSYGNIMDSLEKVYNSDLDSHFNSNLLEHPKFLELMNTPYFLMLSWTFILEKYIQNPRAAISLLKNVLKNVALSIDDKYIDSVGIYENIVWSASQRINERAGWVSMKLYEDWNKYYTNPKFENCDITIHHNTVTSCREIKT